MKENSVYILHLSDLHIQHQHISSSRDRNIPLYEEIANHIRDLKITTIIIVDTGDIVNATKVIKEYTKRLNYAKDFYANLKEHLKKYDCKIISLQFVPGNHDINRRGKNKLANFYKLTNELREIFGFQTQNKPLIFDTISIYNNININFFILNTSIKKVTTIKKYIDIISTHYNDYKPSGQNFNILITHHSINSLDKKIKNYFFKNGGLSSSTNIILCGHEHINDIGLYRGLMTLQTGNDYFEKAQTKSTQRYAIYKINIITKTCDVIYQDNIKKHFSVKDWNEQNTEIFYEIKQFNSSSISKYILYDNDIKKFIEKFSLAIGKINSQIDNEIFKIWIDYYSDTFVDFLKKEKNNKKENTEVIKNLLNSKYNQIYQMLFVPLKHDKHDRADQTINIWKKKCNEDKKTETDVTSTSFNGFIYSLCAKSLIILNETIKEDLKLDIDIRIHTRLLKKEAETNQIKYQADCVIVYDANTKEKAIKSTLHSKQDILYENTTIEKANTNEKHSWIMLSANNTMRCDSEKNICNDTNWDAFMTCAPFFQKNIVDEHINSNLVKLPCLTFTISLKTKDHIDSKTRCELREKIPKILTVLDTLNLCKIISDQIDCYARVFDFSVDDILKENLKLKDALKKTS